VKVIICGGRDYRDFREAFPRLDYIHHRINITEVIEGGQSGGDEIGRLWATMHLIPCTTVHAQWNLYGRKAGPLRNVQMAEMKPDLVIAQPGGIGTEGMIRIAKERDIRVIRTDKVVVPQDFRVPSNAEQGKFTDDDE
jgi:hypothetical protein